MQSGLHCSRVRSVNCKVHAKKRSLSKSQRRKASGRLTFGMRSDRKILFEWHWLAQSFLCLCVLHFMHFSSSSSSLHVLKRELLITVLGIRFYSPTINSLEIFLSFSVLSRVTSLWDTRHSVLLCGRKLCGVKSIRGEMTTEKKKRAKDLCTLNYSRGECRKVYGAKWVMLATRNPIRIDIFWLTLPVQAVNQLAIKFHFYSCLRRK